MKYPSVISVSRLSLILPCALGILATNTALATNPPPGTTAPSPQNCGGSTQTTASLAWSLDVGKSSYGNPRNLLTLSRVGVSEGSITGGKLRNLSEMMKVYGGGDRARAKSRSSGGARVSSRGDSALGKYSSGGSAREKSGGGARGKWSVGAEVDSLSGGRSSKGRNPASKVSSSSSRSGTIDRQSLTINLDEKTISSRLASPSVLSLGSTVSGADVIRYQKLFYATEESSGQIVYGPLEQILTDTAFTDISVPEGGEGSSYTIKMWSVANLPALQKTPPKSDPDDLSYLTGRYILPDEQQYPPMLEVTFSNPDFPDDNGRIDKTQVERTGNGTRTTTTRYEETFVTVDRQAPESLSLSELVAWESSVKFPETFTITTYEGPDVTGSRLRVEKLIYSNRGTGHTAYPPAPGEGRYWDYNIERTIHEAHLNADGSVVPVPADPSQNGGDFLVSHKYETYQDFSPLRFYTSTSSGDAGSGTGSEGDLPSEESGSGNTQESNEGAYVITMYDLADEGGSTGARRMVELIEGYGSSSPRKITWSYHNDPSNSLVHSRLKSLIRPDGSWEYYEYADSAKASVAIETKYSSWKNVPITDYQNALKEENIIGKKKLSTTVSIAGQTIEKTEVIYSTIDGGDELTTTRMFTGTEWLEEKECRHSDDAGALLAGRLKWEELADGTAITYSYSQTGTNTTVTMDQGEGDRNGITAGTRTVTTRNSDFTDISETTGDVETSLTFGAWVKSDLDAKGRPQRTDYSDGTYSISRYYCCGLGFTQSRTGATTEYSYDAIKRRYRAVSKRSSGGTEITTGTALAGLTTTSTRSDGNTVLFANSTTRNLAGETITSKSPDADGDNLPETTTIVTSYPTEGGKTVSMTYPDGSTSVRTTFADGTPRSQSGTARPAMTYDCATHALNGGGIVKQATAANGTQWTKTYSDQYGRNFRTEFPDGAFSTVAYHPFSAAAGSRGQVASATDPDNITVSYQYNSKAELILTTTPMPGGQQRLTATDSDVVSDPGFGVSYRTTTTVNGILVSTILRDSLGYGAKSITLGGTSTGTRTVPADGAWTVTTTAPDGTYTVATYTDGLLKKQEAFASDDTLIGSKQATHDGFGRTLTSVDSRTGTTTIGAYLDNGRVLSVTDPGNRTTSYTYDNMGRVVSTDLPDTLDADGTTLGNITYTSYTFTGKVSAKWGAQTNPTLRVYDSLDRLTELRTYQSLAFGTEPEAATTGFAKTTWIYSTGRGFLIGKRDDTDKGADYAYTSAGRLATRTWERGTTTTYSYDAGMLATTDYSDTTPDVVQTYDNFGRPTRTTNIVSTTDYAYDPATLVLDTETISHDTDSDGTPELTRVIDRKQDNLLRPTGYLLKDGTTTEQETTYTYDTTGRLGTVADANDTFTYGYLADSNLLETVTGPAHTVTNTYDTTRDVLLTRENEVGTTGVSDYGYSVNAIGQRTGVSQAGTAFQAVRSTAWGYDSLGQVTKADSTIPGLDRAYQYDMIGNRLKSAESLTLPASDNYTANSLNQYTAIGANTPSYDDDGNATAYPLPADTSANSTLVWDAENRLIEVQEAGTSVPLVRFVYDSQSRRIAKTEGTETTLYLYDGWNPIWRGGFQPLVSSTTVIEETYLWGTDLSGTMQGAGGVGGLLSVTQGGSAYYPSYDGNGNVSEYLDFSGAVAAHYEYDPFGKTVVATGSKAADFSHRFSTKPLDQATGLYYYGYRYYDPETGRWPSRDPIGENGGINLYAFIKNNAVDWWDNLGKKMPDRNFNPPPRRDRDDFNFDDVPDGGNIDIEDPFPQNPGDIDMGIDDDPLFPPLPPQDPDPEFLPPIPPDPGDDIDPSDPDYIDPPACPNPSPYDPQLCCDR
ncbi:MAG: RHS repeat domain-containing protein [Luteolibacter sp.]